MVLDLGTGDGKAVLRRARRESTTLVIGLDAGAAAMRESSQRAARPTKKGGVANALFLSAAAEELPGPLAGTLDLITVVLPWGSLLRGLVRAEPTLMAGLQACLRDGGQVEMLLSVEQTDHSAGVPCLGGDHVGRLTEAYQASGLTVAETRLATVADVDRLSSSWAKRLGVPHRRAAWLLRFAAAASAERSTRNETETDTAGPADRDPTVARPADRGVHAGRG